jgi:hypothetical protein
MSRTTLLLGLASLAVVVLGPSAAAQNDRGADRDADGIADVSDLCPRDPEDRDAFEDEDGCPDADNDRDGVLDANDRCPNDPENVNGRTDADGCPD